METDRPYNVRDTAQALYLLAEFCNLYPNEAREVARTLNQYAELCDDEFDPQDYQSFMENSKEHYKSLSDRPTGNVWLASNDAPPVEIAVPERLSSYKVEGGENFVLLGADGRQITPQVFVPSAVRNNPAFDVETYVLPKLRRQAACLTWGIM